MPGSKSARNRPSHPRPDQNRPRPEVPKPDSPVLEPASHGLPVVVYSTQPCTPRPPQPWWIYENMVTALIPAPGKRSTDWPAGTTVEVRDQHSSTRGWAVYNPHSRIRARVFARGPETVIWDGATACRLLEEAYARRQSGPGLLPRDPATMGWRLAFGEADFLPGLILDVLGPVLVVQVNSAAAEAVAEEVARHGARLLGTIRRVILRRDTAARELEGLGVMDGAQELEGPGLEPGPADPGPVAVGMDGGFELLADGVCGQKTGLFLDQRLNRQLLAPYVADQDVLDMHCHVGGWALAAVAAGARSALGVDASEAAVDLARRAAALPANQPFGARARFEQADDLEWLRTAASRASRFGVVVLDPPALAKAARHSAGALRTHHQLARQALRLLGPGGILVHCCCSQVITPDQLEEAITQAAAREGAQLHILHRLAQPGDHPVLAGHPATSYLKGFILRRIG